MGRFNKLETLNYIKKTKVVPVFYDPSLEVTIEVVSACYRGGIKILEFTNRGDGRGQWGWAEEVHGYLTPVHGGLRMDRCVSCYSFFSSDCAATCIL